MSILILAGLCQAEDAVAPKPPPAPAAAEAKPDQRTDLNLLGKTDTGSGESRRNENVQFNPIDNNALKELNVRMGTTATLVQEFQADRGYFSAEFGNKPTAPPHLADAKSAAGVHGSLYETHGNSVFGARSFFQAGGVKPARDNDYGFAVGAKPWRGGSISIEGSQQKIRGSVNGNILVPQAGERTALTADPAARAVVMRFLSAFPNELPNRTDIDARALNTNAPQRIDTDNGGVRLDQRRGARDRFTLQYSFTGQVVDAFELLAGQNPDTTTKAHTARATWSRAWSANTVTNFTAGFDRTRSLIVPEPNAVGPTVTFGNALEGLGPGSDLPIDRAQNRFRYAGQVRRVHARHSWTAGGETARRQINGSEISSQRGVFYFRNDFGRDAITNFRMGVPSRFSTGIGSFHRGFRNWEYQFYAGDTWRARPNLTLTYGLRYQPVTGVKEVNGLTPIPYGCDCNNLAPRFGLAYRLGGRGGVLRAAYGTDYGEIYPVTFQQLRWNPPLVLKLEVQSPNLVNPLGSLGPADLRPDARSTLFNLSSNLTTPYSHQYNFMWEPALSRRWKMQFGYLGSRSHKLLIFWPTNRAQPVAGIEQTTATINLRRPRTDHFEIRRILNGSQGYYDAARASLALANWHGLDMDAAYWFGKAIDLGAAYTNTAAGEDALQARSQSEFNTQQDLKGLSPFDQTHSFLLRFGYVTPALKGKVRALGRWNVSLVNLVKSGAPFDVFSGSDGPGYGNVDGAAGDRPNILDPAILGRTIGDPDTSRALLPRSAFGYIQPVEQRGNLGHNVFRRGGIRNVNAAMSRSWTFGAEKTLTFRAESINLSNTPQFAAPGKELSAQNFGQITNTLNDGRTFRFLLRLRF